MDVQRTMPSPRKLRQRWVVASGIAVVCLAAVAALRPSSYTAPVSKSDIVIDTVRRGEFIRTVRGLGELVPRESRSIAALTSGRVDRVIAKPGDDVEADTVVLELTNEELAHTVSEAESALIQSQAEIAARKLNLKSQVLEQRSRLSEAKSNFTSAKVQADAEAFAGNAVSRVQAERSRLLAEQAAERVSVEFERLETLTAAVQADLRAQDAKVAQSRKELERQRELHASLKVKADMAGVLQSIAVTTGQQVVAGSELARVAKRYPLVAQIRVPGDDARDVQRGQSAHVDLRGATIAGRVTRVDPVVEKGAVRVEIELLETLPAGARPDLSVDGTINIERLPNRLIVGRLPHNVPGSEVTLFRLNSDEDRASRVRVRIGASSVKETEILSGLSPGDKIIISSLAEWNGRGDLQLQ